MRQLHVKSSVSLILSLSFLISSKLPFSLCKELRDEEAFDYDGGEMEKEMMTGEVPRFVVHDETIKVKEHDDVSFNCEVDKLGLYDIMFKEDPQSNNIISVGNTVIKSEYMNRIELVRLSEDRGMSLTLKNVTIEDSGLYACLLNHPSQNRTVTFDLTVEEPSLHSHSLNEGETGGTTHLREASSVCGVLSLFLSFIFCFNFF